MLKKLVLGLLTLSILASPTKYFSAAKPEISPDVQIQKKNATDLLCEGVSINGPVSGGVGGGGGHIPVGTTPISFNPDLLLENDPKVFTVTFDLNAMIHLFSDITYESNDGSLLLSRSIGYCILEYKVMAENTVGVHEFYADTYKGRTCLYRAFSYIYKNKVYISRESKEDAWREAVVNDYKNGVLTKAQVEDEYADFLLLSSPNSNEATDVELPPRYSQHPNNQTAKIYSHVEWQDEQQIWMPLTLCKVSLYINGSCVQQSSLDEDGYVFFNIGSNSQYWGKTCKVQLRIYTQTDTFTLGNKHASVGDYSPIGAYDEYYMIVSDKIETLIDERTNLNIPARRVRDEYEKTSNALSMCQALALCERFAMQNVPGFKDNRNLSLFHLNIETSDESCWFSFQDASSLFREGARDWAYPFRLYGLYVQGILNMLGSNTYIQYDYDYGNFMYEEEHQIFGKNMAAQTVWHRSLADMFAILIFLSFDYETRHSAVAYGLINFVNTVEHYVPDDTAGEGSILCVTTYLFNIYNGYRSKYDRVVEGKESASDFFKFTFIPGVSTFNEFINYRYETLFAYPTSMDNNSLLENLCIAPSGVRLIGGIDENTNPVFEWKAGGCASHPNDVFDIWIWGGVGNEQHIKNIRNNSYTMRNGIVNFTFTGENKTKLLNAMNNNASDSNTCYVSVCGYREDGNYKTGPYYSTFARITKPEIIDDEPVFERRIELRDTRDFETTIPVRFRKTANTVFYTRGCDNSTIGIYDEFDRKLVEAQDDEPSYLIPAFVSYNINAETTYFVKISATANSGEFRKWVYLDIIQNVNSYERNNLINHPDSFQKIREVYTPFYLPTNFDVITTHPHEEDYNEYYFDVERGSTALLLFEPDYSEGFSLEIQYTENINVALVFYESDNSAWNRFYHIGSGYYYFKFPDCRVNFISGQPMMILITRENNNGQIPTGSLNKSFKVVCTNSSII